MRHAYLIKYAAHDVLEYQPDFDDEAETAEAETGACSAGGGGRGVFLV